MDGIALGALLAVVGRFWGPVTQYWKLYALAGVFLVGGDLALRFLHVTSGHRVFGYSFPSFAAVAFLVWTLLHLGQRQTAFLRFPGLTYIGKISYGVYLFHEPLGYVTQPLLRFAGVDLDAGSLTLLFARIAFSIAVASLSWFVFEKPILRLKGRFVTKVARRPAEAQPVATV
jgi:peptidoglycan/LPS O-acetylase OafA/YrhL